MVPVADVEVGLLRRRTRWQERRVGCRVPPAAASAAAAASAEAGQAAAAGQAAKEAAAAGPRGGMCMVAAGVGQRRSSLLAFSVWRHTCRRLDLEERHCS